MTFDEIDQKLPNGFHDAKIETVVVDYVKRSVTITMHFWIGAKDGPNREEYRKGTLDISGLYYYTIEAPDAAYPFMRNGTPLNVAGYPENSQKFSVLNDLLAVIPKSVTCYRFFVHDWNSFIHIAARDVQIS